TLEVSDSVQNSGTVDVNDPLTIVPGPSFLYLQQTGGLTDILDGVTLSITGGGDLTQRGGTIQGGIGSQVDLQGGKYESNGVGTATIQNDVTVNAGSAWYAEVLAKAALLAGPVAGRELIERTDTTALFVDVHGAVGTVGALKATRLEP
ncbi:MAG: hypothetical protein ACE5GB_04975, partial [Acidimicrobiales bacterium]